MNISWMDSLRDDAYLETDKPENVAFYRSFGFAVVGEVAILDTPTWLMSRAAHQTIDSLEGPT